MRNGDKPRLSGENGHLSGDKHNLSGDKLYLTGDIQFSDWKIGNFNKRGKYLYC